MALDANLKKVPLTANFVEKSDGTVIIEGLIADPSVALSAVHAVKDVTPVGGSAGGGSDAGGDIYFLAMYDTAGGLIKSDEVLYNNDSRTIHTPSLTVYKSEGVNVSGALNVSGNHNVIGNHSVTGTLDVTGVTNAHGVLRGNNIVSALSGLSVSGELDVVNTKADTLMSMSVDNQDGGATSDAALILKVASTGGDAYVRMFENGGNSWCVGIYTQGSPGTNFRIADHTNLDSNVALEIDGSQDVWMPQSLAVGQSAKAQDYVALEVTSDVGGFLPPRMTTTQRDNMTPPTGLIIFNTTDTAVQFWNGGAWRSM
tara:strand:+ start:512 stop:1453 length:942 start_codon:yes stop_codon:yes gene_type:complete